MCSTAVLEPLPKFGSKMTSHILTTVHLLREQNEWPHEGRMTESGSDRNEEVIERPNPKMNETGTSHED